MSFDRWKVQDYAPGQGAREGVFGENVDDTGWLDIPVPGDVHRALIAAGRIPDPFYDRNEAECAWMEDREWWYRTRFDGPVEPMRPDERLRLVFHGLDTFATVWLNGEELGRHASMFYPAEFDVTDRVRAGQPNILAVLFDRPLDHVAGMEEAGTWGEGDAARAAMRKAQFGYGWDWGPRLPTIGLWRPVELLRQRRAVISGVHAVTREIDREHRHALLAVRVEVDRFAGTGPLTTRIVLSEKGGRVVAEQTLTLDGAGPDLHDSAYLRVEQPRLWWTHDLGDPALYTLEARLESDDVASGEDPSDGATLDTRRETIGIRTIELDQSPDPGERGTRFFRFILNGTPLFARGTNWIPADSFVGSIEPGRYTRLIEAARDANMTMQRVWGGGIYEHDVFYDECDRLGLLVWQDFMFACAMYPENDPDFVREVRAEAHYQVRRLRNHASLALWCGNNENQWLHDKHFWDRPDYPVPGTLYYDKILPEAVAMEDGYTPYWPGSPYGGNDYDSTEDGDHHNWQVWHGSLPRRFGEEPRTENTPDGVSYRHYGEDMGRFISEFGMHAAPVLDTLRRVIPEDQLYHHSPSMDHHNKDNPKNKGDNLMLAATGLPSDLEEYIDFSMIAQAEGLKFGIEHYRRRAPHCAGTLVWQLNDCWPVLSWSVLDYYGVGKAGYYYLKRVYAPVLASFKELPDGGAELWISNDTTAAVDDAVTVRLGGFNGETQWEETRAVTVPALTSVPVWRWSGKELAAAGPAPERYLAVWSGEARFPENRHFFTPVKDLRRERVQPEVAITAVNAHELRIDLQASAYAYFVHLLVPRHGTQFSDNYFDVLPGRSRSVTVRNARVEVAPEMVTVRWR